MTDGISVVKLPGGLTAVLQENHDTPVVSALFFVRVGSADETDDQAGLAHLHEHMIFKGTPKRPVGRIAAEIEGAGGEINAYTTFDHTCYYVTMSSRYWTVGLDVLADALQNASLDAEELDRERHVILEEMSRSEDMPSNVVSRNLFKTMFRRHPYRRPIIGTRNVILGMQRCDVVAFFRRYYRPANVVAVVAGDFDPRDAEKRLRAAYAEAAPAAVRRPKRAAETAQRSARLALAFQPVQEATFELGYPAPHVLHPDTAVADIASLVLGGGDSARLVREVKRKRKLVYETFSYCYNLVDAGVFSAGGVCDPRRTVAAVRATAREVARLADRGLGQAELDKAKRIVESWFVYERETPSGLAKKLGYSYLFTGGLDYDERYLDRLAAVTRDDVRAYAADYLSPRRATLSLLAPPNFKNRLTKDAFREVLNGKSPARRAVRKSVSPAARAERPPTVAATAGQRHRLKMTRLSNGVRLIVKESTQTAIFSVKAVMHGGLRLEGRDHAGLSRLTTSLLTKGTKRHSADAFAEAVDGLAGGVSGFSGRNSVGVSGEFLSRDFEQGLELTAEALIDPTFPDEEIELARADTLAAIARREDQPDRRCIDLFLETLFTRHPYGVSMLGTPETLGRLSRRRLRAFHRAVVRPKELVVAVVGDVSFEQARRAAEKQLGRLKASGRALRDPRPEASFTGARSAVLRVDKSQAHLVIGFLGTTITSRDRHALELLNALLSGQSGRLFMELRDRRHLAYSVTSFNHEGQEPGAFGLYIGTSPDRVDEARRGIWEQVLRLRDELVPAAELESAKRYLVGAAEIDMAHLSTVAQSMALDELLGLSYKEPFRVARRMEGITPERLRDVARRYLRPDAFAEALVTPPDNGKE